MTEVILASGIVLPTMAGELRSWLKLRAEPAQVLAETPLVFMHRWRDFVMRCEAYEQGGRVGLPPVLVVHDNTYGQAMFFLPEARDQIAFVGVTYPTTTQARTTPGSIWAGQCPCAEFGGACPPLG
jgi:hypothetical protein